MHFAQGENIAFVLPSSGWAPSGAICQLSLSLLALFICLASQRAGGGAGNRLGPPDNGKSQGLLIPRGFFWGGGVWGGCFGSPCPHSQARGGCRYGPIHGSSFYGGDAAQGAAWGGVGVFLGGGGCCFLTPFPHPHRWLLGSQLCILYPCVSSLSSLLHSAQEEPPAAGER